MKKTIILGKIDATKNGKKDCTTKIEICLENGRFTASGWVCDSRGKCIQCGQCLDEIEKYIEQIENETNKAIFYKVLQWWDLYHLNDMHAGTPEQEHALRKVGLCEFANKYKECCDYLQKIGLLVVRGHRFGCAWLREEIPADIQKEMQELLKD